MQRWDAIGIPKAVLVQDCQRCCPEIYLQETEMNVTPWLLCKLFRQLGLKY